MNKRLLIAVVGPTASGKSELAVQIAQRFNGEIISADSRQIYKNMDIGTGKVSGHWARHPELAEGSRKSQPVFLYKGIPHYLIDEASPKVQYSVARFQKQARKVITDIHKRDKLPIICGGTGMWVDAVVYNSSLPEVKPNAVLRKKLAKLSAGQLFIKLQKLDPTRAKTIDKHNPRRLVRALEIVLATGQPVPKVKQTSSSYQVIWVGLDPGKEKLVRKIKQRLVKRLRSGMMSEVKQLHKTLSWQKLESFGLEYKFLAQQLQQKLTKKEAHKQLLLAITHYSKRQMTWWKRNSQINWFIDSKSALAWINQRLRKELNS